MRDHTTTLRTLSFAILAGLLVGCAEMETVERSSASGNGSEPESSATTIDPFAVVEGDGGSAGDQDTGAGEPGAPAAAQPDVTAGSEDEDDLPYCD